MADTIVGALRVLRDHWPALVGIFLFGWIGRMGFLWLATEVSKLSPTVAVLILPLAPLSTIVALVLMLRIVAVTLPAFEQVFATMPARQRWHDHATVVGQVLLPFLAVYASQGLLRQDTLVFLEDTTMDELMNNAIPTFDRAVYAEGVWLIVMVAAVLILRKLLSLTGWSNRSVMMSAFATYLEILWLVTLVQTLASRADEFVVWIRERAVIDGIIEGLDSVVSWLGDFGLALAAFIGWLGDTISNLASVIVMPISMLAVGAAVYGRELKDGPPIPTHEGMTRRLKKVPNPMKRLIGQLLEPVTTPVMSAWNSFGRIIVAGLIPTLLFCLVFVLLNQLDNAVALIMHQLIGPRSRELAFAVEPYLNLVSNLCFTVAAVALLAAAVNVLVAKQGADLDDARD